MQAAKDTAQIHRKIPRRSTVSAWGPKRQCRVNFPPKQRLGTIVKQAKVKVLPSLIKAKDTRHLVNNKQETNARARGYQSHW